MESFVISIVKFTYFAKMISLRPRGFEDFIAEHTIDNAISVAPNQDLHGRHAYRAAERSWIVGNIMSDQGDHKMHHIEQQS
jgi:hypothetical protein